MSSVGFRLLRSRNKAVNTDPNVKLLLHANGTNGATTFTDSSGWSKTPSIIGGNVQLSTAQQKFGTASMLFDGTTDYLDYGDDADFQLGSLATVECFIRTSSFAAQQIVFSKHGAGDSALSMSLDDATNMRMYSYQIDNATPVYDSTFAHGMSTNTWYHICLQLWSGNWGVYRDGTRIATGATTGTMSTGTGVFQIGARGTGSSFNGYIDEFRLTNGTTKYATGGFTAPTAEHANP